MVYVGDYVEFMCGVIECYDVVVFEYDEFVCIVR